MLTINKCTFPREVSNNLRANLWIRDMELNPYGTFIPYYSFLLRSEVFELLDSEIDDEVSNDKLLDLSDEIGVTNLIISDECPISGYKASREMIRQLLPKSHAERLNELGDREMVISFADSHVNKRLRFKDIIQSKGSWLMMPTFVGKHVSIKNDDVVYKVRSKITEYIGERGGDLNIIFPKKQFTCNRIYGDMINTLIENSLERTRHNAVCMFHAPTNLPINKKYTVERKDNLTIVKRKKNV